MTNYEKIQNMTVEEMAQIIMCPDCCFNENPYGCTEEKTSANCIECTRDYLNSEVEE